MSFNKIRMGYKVSLKSTNFRHENMQHLTKSTNFELFLNLNINESLHLKELIFWIYVNNTKKKKKKKEIAGE